MISSICSSKYTSGTCRCTNSDPRAPVWEQRLDEQASYTRQAIGLADQAVLFGNRERRVITRCHVGAAYGQGVSYFFGDVSGLIIREVMPPPEFEGVRDDRVELLGFRLCIWSTRCVIFSGRLRRKKPAIVHPPGLLVFRTLSHSTQSLYHHTWSHDEDKVSMETVASHPSLKGGPTGHGRLRPLPRDPAPTGHSPVWDLSQ